MVKTITAHQDLIADNLCPVCGYEMEEPSRDYNICPSCGTEFGLHDANASLEELRSAWIKTGPKWWSTTDPLPKDWNPFYQLARLHSHGASFVGAHRVFFAATNSTGAINQAEAAMKGASLAMTFSMQLSSTQHAAAS